MKYSDFKKMDFYHAFEDWLYSEISGDFYSPPLYSDDGDLLKDAEFDEDGCDRAVENTIKAAVLVYDQLDHDPIKLRNKSGDELLKMAGMDNCTTSVSPTFTETSSMPDIAGIVRTVGADVPSASAESESSSPRPE